MLAGCLWGCGGGGGEESGILIEGTLQQGDVEMHAAGLSLIHSAGERIDGVQICTLGECAQTDADGQWGLIAPEAFESGSIDISVLGHGIDAHLVVHVPEGALNVNLTLEHLGDGSVVATAMQVDGADHDPNMHDDGEDHSSNGHSHEM